MRSGRDNRYVPKTAVRYVWNRLFGTTNVARTGSSLSVRCCRWVATLAEHDESGAVGATWPHQTAAETGRPPQRRHLRMPRAVRELNSRVLPAWLGTATAVIATAISTRTRLWTRLIDGQITTT